MELPAGAENAREIVIAGMGGSATASDYFAALCRDASEIPVTVVRGYSLPNHVSDGSLVIVSSYSGNTEESLSAYDDAWKRGATLMVLTGGGELAARASADGVSVLHIGYASQPRAAIAHGLGPLLRIGQRLDLCAVDDAIVSEAAGLHRDYVHDELGPDVASDRNPAKQLADALHGRIPLVLGAEHLTSVASRFKNQVAENGKALGAYDVLPEADHNLIVGLGTGDQAAASLSLVTLESDLYDRRTQLRFEVTGQLFGETGIPLHRHRAAGDTPLAQILHATAIGDYASTYLAFLNGVDPSPVPPIVRLKEALTAHAGS